MTCAGGLRTTAGWVRGALRGVPRPLQGAGEAATVGCRGRPGAHAPRTLADCTEPSLRPRPHDPGVDKFYIMDHNSSRPMLPALMDWVRDGVVEYAYFTGASPRQGGTQLHAAANRDNAGH